MHTLIEKYMERAFGLVSGRERNRNPSVARHEERMKQTLLALKENTVGRKEVISNDSEGGVSHVKECAND